MDLSNEMTSSAARGLEDEVVVESAGSTSAFECVSFVDVKATYPPSEDIAIQYSVGVAVETSSRDWIGLYKVGWKTPKDYYTFEWAPSVGEENRTCSVVFQARRLPRDETSSFQFCYVTKAGEVRGVSTPFRVKNSVDDDLECIELQDENLQSVVLVNSRNFESQVEAYREQNALLESTMQRTKTEYTALQEQLETAESRVEVLESEKESVLQRERTVHERLAKMEEDSNTYAVEKGRQIAELQRELETAHITKAQLQEELENAAVGAQLKADENRMAALQAEEVIRELERAREDLQMQLDEEKERIRVVSLAMDAEVREKQELKERLQFQCDEFEDSKANLVELQRAVAERQRCNEELTGKLSETQQQLSASEDQLEAQSSELAELTREVENLQGERSALQVQCSQMQEEFDRQQQSQQSSSSIIVQSNIVELMGERTTLQEELETARKRILELEEDLTKPQGADSGAMFALRRAYEHSESQKEELVREREALRQQLRVQRAQQATVQSLEAEASELRCKCQEFERRLELGAEAYKEKFLECRNLTKQLQQLKESHSRSDMPESEQVEQLSSQLADVQAELANVEEQRSTLDKALVLQTEQRDEMQRQHEVHLAAIQAESDRKIAELTEELEERQREMEKMKRSFEEQNSLLQGVLEQQQEQQPQHHLVRMQPEVHDRSRPTPHYSVVPRDRATEDSVPASTTDPVIESGDQPHRLARMQPELHDRSRPTPQYPVVPRDRATEDSVPRTTVDPILESGDQPRESLLGIRSCPLCNVSFPRSKTQAEYEAHVNSHFDN